MRSVNENVLIFSSVYNLFFNGQMESKICEANTHPPAGGFGWCENCLMGISFKHILFYIGQIELYRNIRNSF